MRAEIGKGRVLYKVSQVQSPFFDLIAEGLEEELTKDTEDKLIELTGFIFKYIKEGVQIGNFWEKNDEKKKVIGKIEQRIRLSGMPGLKAKNKELATQLMMLAKNNYSEILKSCEDES